MGGVNFFPAHNFSRYGFVDGEHHNVWNSRGFFKYPYLFVSYQDSKKFENLRREWGIDSDIIVMSDSGGFQILTRGARIDPVEVIEWQNNNVDVGHTLDVPPYIDPLHAQIRSDWYDCLEQTVLNSRIMYERKKESMLLYGTIHGGTDDMKKWWKECVDSVGDWDGYAIGLRDHPTEIIKAVRFILSNHIIDKPLHFFGVGATVPFFLLSRFSHTYSSTITVDSASFGNRMKGYNFIYDPIHLGRTLPVGSEGRTTGKVYNRVGCLCPVCQVITKMDYTQYQEFVIFHNLYMTIWHYSVLNSLATEDYKTLSNFFPRETIDYIKTLDSVIGVDDTSSSSSRGLEEFLTGEEYE
jgi:hypothetical protein